MAKSKVKRLREEFVSSQNPDFVVEDEDEPEEVEEIVGAKKQKLFFEESLKNGEKNNKTIVVV